MSVQTSKPNFRILEGCYPEVDYEEFKKDFLNPHILVDELRRKYNISLKVYHTLRKKVMKDTGVWKKPCQPQQHFINGVPIYREYKSAEYIQEINGDYVIIKTTGYVTRHHGRYEDYETAKMVRDKLVACNWNLDVSNELKALYGKKHLKPSLEKARAVYDEYEKRYFFDREHTLAEIKKELNITGRMYDYLLMMLRDKHGQYVNRRMYD